MFSYRIENQNILTNHYMKMIAFSCNTENPISLLKWYNSVETQGAMNNFYNVQLIENG